MRVVAVDDGAFRRRQRWAPLVAVVFSTPDRVEGILRSRVRVDGDDATDRIAELLRGAPHFEGVRAILTDGACFGGFNVLDVAALARRTGRPVVAVTRRRPEFPRIRAALAKWFPRDHRRRFARLTRPPLRRVPSSPLYMAVAGCSRRDAGALVARTVREGHWPEPLRLAHLVGHALGTALPEVARAPSLGSTSRPKGAAPPAASGGPRPRTPSRGRE